MITVVNFIGDFTGIIIIVTFTPWEFFSSAFVDGLSQESEWQVSSSLQDSSQHSCWSQQCYSLDCLHSSSYLMSSSYFTNHLVTVSRAQIKMGTAVTFMFHSFLQFPSKVEVFIFLFTFFQFYSVVSWDSKVHNPASSLFFCWLL